MSQAKAYPASLASADALVAAGLVEAEQRDVVARVAQTYAIGVSATMADLIDRRDPRDPIARQFIPDPAELSVLPEERVDPIGDAAASPVEAIVHRYPDQVLLKLLHICPVYCRFCFRREVVGPGTPTHLSAAALDRAFAYIADHDEIWEVILTGGDPLVLSPRRLRDVFAKLRSIAHVRIVGFTRASRSSNLRLSAKTWSPHSAHPERRSMSSCMPITRVNSRCRRAPPAAGSSTPAYPCSVKACCCVASTTLSRPSRA